MMLYRPITLSGAWDMDYAPEAYLDEKLPQMCGTIVKNAVPGYWEDMKDAFADTHFFKKLKINPEYTEQSYPIFGDVPDMVLPNYVGTFFYSKVIDCADISGAPSLHFEGVQNRVSVWVNGTYIGHHEGYSAPFDMEIPNGVLALGKNTLVLAVSNHMLEGYDGQIVSGLTSRAANEYSGGITGEAELRFYTSALRDMYVNISKDCSRADVEVVSNGNVELSWSLYDGDTLVKEGRAGGSFSFDTEGLEFWSPESPKRYRLVAMCDGAELTRIFGVRRLTVDGTGLRLNGEPYYLRGICEHCYYPETVHLTHDAKFYREVIGKLKELGFNFIRFHTYVPTREYLAAADELGMIVHIESPNNTSLEEWREIVNLGRHYTCVSVYCCGNELLLDEPFIEHLNKCADIVHEKTDALFSPMSALRGLEYYFHEPELDHEIVYTPFKHNPRRFELVKPFTDVFNSYTIERNSYYSHRTDPALVDSWSGIYNKPRIAHEICIDGTYADLSLEERYKWTRVGNTAMFSSVREHLKSKGVLDKAQLYFKNSCEWQRRMRKHCFEETRMSRELAGYDFLGPIDTHWHTFGYDVGMMNEFYEMKPGESVENVLRYNSPTVLLTENSLNANYYCGENMTRGVYISHFGNTLPAGARLDVHLCVGDEDIYRQEVTLDKIERGSVQKLCELKTTLPALNTPAAIKMSATLTFEGDTIAENEWELFMFPRVNAAAYENITVLKDADPDTLKSTLAEGKRVLVVGKLPFVKLSTSIRIALAGRNAGNLATVINDHPSIDGLAHDGFCAWQFSKLLEGGEAVCFEQDDVPFDPIIEVVSTHKNVIRQAALFEFSALGGEFLVCGFNFVDTDPAANWLLAKLMNYVSSGEFAPRNTLSEQQLDMLLYGEAVKVTANKNLAFNANDKTAIRKKK